MDSLATLQIDPVARNIVGKWRANVSCQQLLNPVWRLVDFFFEDAIALSNPLEIQLSCTIELNRFNRYP